MVKEKLGFLGYYRLIKLLAYECSCTHIVGCWVFVRGGSQARCYFEESLEQKAVISLTSYKKLRWEIAALIFSTVKEILEKI